MKGFQFEWLNHLVWPVHKRLRPTISRQRSDRVHPVWTLTGRTTGRANSPKGTHGNSAISLRLLRIFLGRRGLRPAIRGIIAVQGPFGRVVADILPDGIQFLFIPHHMFVIIALPHGRGGRGAQNVDAFRGRGDLYWAMMAPIEPGRRCRGDPLGRPYVRY